MSGCETSMAILKRNGDIAPFVSIEQEGQVIKLEADSVQFTQVEGSNEITYKRGDEGFSAELRNFNNFNVRGGLLMAENWVTYAEFLSFEKE